jgi:hypothetical protein
MHLLQKGGHVGDACGHLWLLLRTCFRGKTAQCGDAGSISRPTRCGTTVRKSYHTSCEVEKKSRRSPNWCVACTSCQFCSSRRLVLTLERYGESLRDVFGSKRLGRQVQQRVHGATVRFTSRETPFQRYPDRTEAVLNWRQQGESLITPLNRSLVASGWADYKASVNPLKQ